MASARHSEGNPRSSPANSSRLRAIHRTVFRPTTKLSLTPFYLVTDRSLEIGDQIGDSRLTVVI